MSTTEQVSYSLTQSRIRKTLRDDTEGRFAHLQPHAEAKEGIPFEGTFDFGTNLDEIVERFGADFVYNMAKQAVGLKVGARVRDWIEAGVEENGSYRLPTTEEIQAMLDSYDPTVNAGRERMSKAEKFIKDAKKAGKTKAQILAELDSLFEDDDEDEE